MKSMVGDLGEPAEKYRNLISIPTGKGLVGLEKKREKGERGPGNGPGTPQKVRLSLKRVT
ncbi:MAG: hypothetical protein HQL35_06510 [Alphaproteobacteria bacterium]|nr:hypothetical protein [Alphaproteobacteria bacterium]